MVAVAVLGPLTALLAGCVGEGGYVDEYPGAGFYAPYGAEYGAFDSGFEVGPFHRFNDFGGGGFGRGGFGRGGFGRGGFGRGGFGHGGGFGGGHGGGFGGGHGGGHR